MLRLDMTKAARSFLSDLPAKQFRQIVNKVFALMENPTPPDSIAMTGYPYRRADIGEYRIIYRLEEQCLKLCLIGKRNDDDVYRQLKRGQF